MKSAKVWKGERCFACDKKLWSDSEGLLNARQAYTRDGQYVVVGLNCFLHASTMNIHGYQPLLGGPRIYTTMLNLCRHTEHGYTEITQETRP